MKKLLLLIGILLCAASVRAQGALISDTATVNVGGYTKVIPNATITVCGYTTATAIPCTNKAAIYTDETLATTTGNPLTADNNGNYSVYALPGKYTISIQGAGTAGANVTRIVPCYPSGTGCGTGASTAITTGNNTWTGTNTFTGALNCKNFQGIRCIDAANSQGWAGATLAAQLQSAINDVDTTGGKSGTVLLASDSTFNFGGTTISGKSFVTIKGFGSGLRPVDVNCSGTGICFDFTNTEHSGLQNVRLGGTNANAGVVLLRLNCTSGTCAQNIFRDLEIVGPDLTTIGPIGIQVLGNGGTVNENWFDHIGVYNINQPIVSSTIEGNWWTHIDINQWFGNGAIAYNSTSNTDHIEIRLSTSQAGTNKIGFQTTGSSNIVEVSCDFGAGHKCINESGSVANTYVVTRPLNLTPLGTINANSTVIDRIGTFVPSGTAANPGLAFAGDQTTGFHSVSAGNFCVDNSTACEFLFATSLYRMRAGNPLTWSSGDPSAAGSDTGFSRESAALIDIGNGAQGDTSGTVKATNYRLSGNIQNLAGTTTQGLTLKKGSGGGNYQTNGIDTNFQVVDSTNLCYTVTIPTGWKLDIVAAGSLSTATAAVTADVALTDNASCSTANAGILLDTGPLGPATGIGNWESFTLPWQITGDGNAHNIALQFKTTTAADKATILNASATQLPTMRFILMPSN